MKSKKITFLIVLVLSLNASTLAQNTTTKDSTTLYKSIESYSRRNKLTKFIYRMLFRPISSNEPKKIVKKKIVRQVKKKPQSAFEGKIIRNIIIETLDPFGYSIADTQAVKQNFFLKGGNKSHIKTQRKTIRNLLVIQQNQIYDSLLVKESERLIRSQSYVRDVAFNTVLVGANSDSVDISIRELDIWTITPKFGLSPTRAVIKLSEKNFLGLGHTSQNDYTLHHKNGDDAFYTNYLIPNFRNTYISTNLRYGTNELGNTIKSLAFDRPFYSPYTKWAAGISLTQETRNDSIINFDGSYIPQHFKTNTQDYWVGNSMQIFHGNSENNRSTNFITALHFIRTVPVDKPAEIYDTTHIYNPENYYLGSVGISTRKYLQDKYIFKYGITEDVPIGKAIALTLGYQEKNKTGRLYMSGRFSLGNMHSWGYLSSHCEYSSFFRANRAEQGLLSVTVIYYTVLLQIGKWKFRQFVKPQLTFGIDRKAGESLNINDGNGIDGFNSSDLIGVNRLLLKFQTQSYAPWDVIGFRFGPYLIFSGGMLSDSQTGFKRSKVYTQIGLGLLIKNDNLVFNTFQVSLSFYPSIPGYKQDAFKINSFKTSDFGYRDFEIGRPSVIGYQ